MSGISLAAEWITNRMKETKKAGRFTFRLTDEQERALDFLVHVMPGKRRRSDLVAQAVDEFTAGRIGRWYEERKKHQLAFEAALGKGAGAQHLTQDQKKVLSETARRRSKRQPKN